jgi:hypothetical protein
MRKDTVTDPSKKPSKSRCLGRGKKGGFLLHKVDHVNFGVDDLRELLRLKPFLTESVGKAQFQKKCRITKLLHVPDLQHNSALAINRLRKCRGVF